MFIQLGDCSPDGAYVPFVLLVCAPRTLSTLSKQVECRSLLFTFRSLKWFCLDMTRSFRVSDDKQQSTISVFISRDFRLGHALVHQSKSNYIFPSAPILIKVKIDEIQHNQIILFQSFRTTRFTLMMVTPKRIFYCLVK